MPEPLVAARIRYRTEPAVRRSRWRAAAWLLMTVGAIGIAMAGLRYLLMDPTLVAGALRGNFERLMPLFMLHVVGGAVALVLGPWQFVERWRTRRLKLHRWLGRAYLLAIAIGGAAGLLLATQAVGGVPARTGFFLLAVAWLSTSAMAYWRVRQRDLAAHREWMIRSYAVTYSAVTLRIQLGLFAVMGVGFAEAYPTVAWLCWVPNLAAAEIWIANTRARRVPGPRLQGA